MSSSSPSDSTTAASAALISTDHAVPSSSSSSSSSDQPLTEIKSPTRMELVHEMQRERKKSMIDMEGWQEVQEKVSENSIHIDTHSSTCTWGTQILYSFIFFTSCQLSHLLSLSSVLSCSFSSLFLLIFADLPSFRQLSIEASWYLHQFTAHRSEWWSCIIRVVRGPLWVRGNGVQCITINKSTESQHHIQPSKTWINPSVKDSEIR